MACMENICKKHNCWFHGFSNEYLKECPRCGSSVLNLFDGLLEEQESNSGDDYNDPLGDE